MIEKIHFCRAVFICRITSIKKHFHHSGGSYYPGKLATLYCPDFLERAAKNVNTVLVVGTNGKTTVSRFISHMLEGIGIHNFSNRSGANMYNGIATAYGLNCTFLGRKKKKTAIIECDELYVNQVIEILKPSVIVVTNIADDQSYRLGNAANTVKIFLKDFKNAHQTAFCLNKDNTYAAELGNEIGQNCYYYSVCGNTILVAGKRFVIPDNIREDYNIENTAAACLCIDLLGYSLEKAIETLKTVKLPFGRMERFCVERTNVLLVLAKNAVSTNAVIRALKQNDDNQVLIFAINNNVTDDVDLSWLDDVDFTTLEGLFSKIYVSGNCGRALCDKFNGVCQILNESTLEFVKSVNSSVTIIANYTAMMEIREDFASHGYIKNFWKD